MLEQQNTGDLAEVIFLTFTYLSVEALTELLNVKKDSQSHTVILIVTVIVLPCSQSFPEIRPVWSCSNSCLALADTVFTYILTHIKKCECV